MGCNPAEEPDSDQVGEYVEMYNQSGEELCPATVSYMDDYLAEVLTFLGEDPPGGRFVEYRWRERSIFGLATPTADGTRITTGSSIHEHELVHAVHQNVWPEAPTFLQEGLAEFLGDTTFIQDAGSWRPTGDELDEALSEFGETRVYGLSWLIVSQIVLEQGFPGLRRFWFALEPSASMQEVRETYTRMFGGSLDDLTQPFEVTINGETGYTKRGVCWVRFCMGEPLTYRDGEVEASGVEGCDDEDAVSPSIAMGQVDPWRDYIVEGTWPPVVGEDTSAGLYVEIEQCGVLRCNHYSVRNAGLADPPAEPWEREDAYRVRVYTNPEEVEPGVQPTVQLLDP